MRITTVLLIIIIIFASGLFSGLMYNSGENTDKTEQDEHVEEVEEVEVDTIEKQIEAELQELNEFPHDGELAQLEYVADHPVQKVAGTFEKGTTYFFDKVVGVLYSLSELAF